MAQRGAEKRQLIARYLKKKESLGYPLKNIAARKAIALVTWSQNLTTQIVGMENMQSVAQGAIITSNHFNPLDNTIIRHMLRQTGKDRLYIVSQESNLAIRGLVGFFMNYADIIPISSDSAYMKKNFPQRLQDDCKTSSMC